MPRCGITDWPAEFDPPPPDPELPDSLPPPFDNPDDDPTESEGIGGSLFTLGVGSRANSILLQTMWSDADHPPELRLGHGTSMTGRQDYYCLVDGLPHLCAWNDEEAAWLSFEDFDPIRAWTIRLLDPPTGGFDWTILWTEQSLEDLPIHYSFGDIERVFVYYGSTEVQPRFDPVLWDMAEPRFKWANGVISVVPIGLAIPRSGDEASVQVRLWNQERCTIPLEVTFLSEGRAIARQTPDGPELVWSMELEPTDRVVDVTLVGVGDLPSGAPLFIHGIMYPGVPGEGERNALQCVSASAGIMQGISVGPYSVFE